jgi:DNA-binding PadR family transcriptional regulator
LSRNTNTHRNLWGLTVLCLLRERQMHPYEMQRLIRERKNDQFLDLKRGSLYHSIEKLQQAGFIRSVETGREGKRPERTVYQLTGEGEQELITWLRELIGKPAHEPSAFFAAVSFLIHLTSDDALRCLQERVTILEAEIGGLDATLRELVPKIGRLVLLEVEYLRAMRQAELEWVRALAADIGAGNLTWDLEAIFRFLRQNHGPST